MDTNTRRGSLPLRRTRARIVSTLDPGRSNGSRGLASTQCQRPRRGHERGRMPIIDDVVERDARGMTLAVADAPTFHGDARAIDDLVHVNALVHDGAAIARTDRWSEVSDALQAAVKRSVDVLVAMTVLVISLPVIAVVALAVVLDSRGPVFYRAARVGG